jgi:hypothetical protein
MKSKMVETHHKRNAKETKSVARLQLKNEIPANASVQGEYPPQDVAM